MGSVGVRGGISVGLAARPVLSCSSGYWLSPRWQERFIFSFTAQGSSPPPFQVLVRKLAQLSLFTRLLLFGCRGRWRCVFAASTSGFYGFHDFTLFLVLFHCSFTFLFSISSPGSLQHARILLLVNGLLHTFLHLSVPI